jgi:aryl-alcohol dehydrogenase-like predicted oxidoreductase
LRGPALDPAVGPPQKVYYPRVRTRRLGNHTVTALGGGDLCLATSAARGVPAGDVERALHEAIAFGITLIDVAGDADSEKLVGNGVRAQRARDRVVVATRVPILAELPGAPKRDVLRERLPVAYVRDRVEASLRASRLEVLPLAQLPLRPAWLGSTAWPELVGTCARLIDEGKVLMWGALLDDPADEAAPALLAEPWLAAVSVVYHLYERRAEPLFAAAASRNLAILARQPLAGGALAGNLGPGVHLPPRDDRHALDDATLERIAVAAAKLALRAKREPPAVRSCDAARQIFENGVRPAHVECNDVAELALRFVIDRAGVALPRLHRREHLLPGITAAAALPLPEPLVERILEGATSDA